MKIRLICIPEVVHSDVFVQMIFNRFLDVEDEFGTKYSVLLSKTYESEKELVPEKKGKVRVTGFKQFVAIVDTPKGLITPFLYFWAR